MKNYDFPSGLPTASLLPRKAPFFVSVTPPGDSNCFAFNRNCSCQNSYLSSWLNQHLKNSLSWNSTEGLKGMATSALQWDPATNTQQVYENKIKYERKRSSNLAANLHTEQILKPMNPIIAVCDPNADCVPTSDYSSSCRWISFTSTDLLLMYLWSPM